MNIKFKEMASYSGKGGVTASIHDQIVLSFLQTCSPYIERVYARFVDAGIFRTRKGIRYYFQGVRGEKEKEILLTGFQDYYRMGCIHKEDCSFGRGYSLHSLFGGYLVLLPEYDPTLRIITKCFTSTDMSAALKCPLYPSWTGNAWCRDSEGNWIAVDQKSSKVYLSDLVKIPELDHACVAKYDSGFSPIAKLQEASESNKVLRN